MSTFFKAVYDYNICTYYLLPLTRQNKHGFGRSNFKNCFVNRRNPHILYVEIVYTPKLLIEVDPAYQGTQKINGKLYLVYLLPDKWAEDVQLFLKGSYFQMSDDAKDHIRKYAGLMIDQVNAKTGKPWTDARILAIDPDPKKRTFLRLFLERELGTEIPPYQELIAPPNESCFLDDLIQEHNITVSLIAQV